MFGYWSRFCFCADRVTEELVAEVYPGRKTAQPSAIRVTSVGQSNNSGQAAVKSKIYLIQLGKELIIYSFNSTARSNRYYPTGTPARGSAIE